jgi:hypothetical protein
MRSTYLFLSLLFSANCFAQATDTLKTQPIDTSRIVSFVSKLDFANVTKDGVYLNGYVVDISYEKARRLDGKKIKVTGKVRIVKAARNQPSEDIQQGRETETRYIDSPKIEIIK